MTRYLFIGDSITECMRQEDPDDLGSGYVRMIAESLPGDQVVNAGIGGHRASHLRERWERDVLARGADVLTVYVGVNDSSPMPETGAPTSPAEFETHYRALLANLPTPRPRLVLVEPFLLPDARAGLPERVAGLDEMRAIVQNLAAETGAVFVTLQERFSAAAAREGLAAIAEDGVHPSESGHRMIAEAWSAAVLGHHS